MTHPNSPLRPAAAVLAVLLLSCGAAMAQYKIVGPDGQVTYTDKPPTAAQQRATNAATGSGGGDSGSFPYETRQAMGRYPVSLFAQKGCEPCDQARRALRTRGIPFSEYSIDTNPDAVALKARFGEMTLPVITVGGQTIKGFRQSDVDSYLDAAGYPKTARLGGYSWPAPVPMAPPVAQQSARTAPAAPSTGTTPIDLPPPSKNGIQF